jgi:hypothetical protein
LCALLAGAYYASPELLHDAIVRRWCANLLHLATGFKVDLFVCRGGDFDRQSLARHVDRSLSEGSRTFRVATAEDMVLRKLEWYRDGGEVSDRQWADVLGILRLRSRELDRAYLHRWAPQLGVSELLTRAEQQAQGGS